jgi:hypothetical protein
VEAKVAVGPSVGLTIFRTVILTVAETLGLLLAGAVWAVVAVLRNRSRRVLPAPAAQPVLRWWQGPNRRGVLPIPAGGTSFAKGTASGGPSTSPTVVLRWEYPCEPGGPSVVDAPEGTTVRGNQDGLRQPAKAGADRRSARRRGRATPPRVPPSVGAGPGLVGP